MPSVLVVCFFVSRLYMMQNFVVGFVVVDVDDAQFLDSLLLWRLSLTTICNNILNSFNCYTDMDFRQSRRLPRA